MKALHVTPYFAPAFRYGGPAQSILGLCQALRAKDVDVRVLTTTADGRYEIPADVVRRGEFEGVPVDYLELSFPKRFFNAIGLVDALRRMLPTVDVVHVHGLWSFPAWLAARECRRYQVPFVVSPRGMLDGGSMAHHRFRKEIGYWLRERRYLRDAALLHATSPAEEESLNRLAIGPRIVRLPNGVSAPSSAPQCGFRERLGIGRDEGVIVFLGRLHPIKRLDLLMASFERAREVQPRTRLVLAGPEDGIDARTLIEGAAEPSAVHYVGDVAFDEKWSLLSEADVLVSCSDSESFGMSVVEAMAMATPVVATKTCPWEELESARAGFWVTQRPEDIADAIVRLIATPELAREMGARGKRLVRERYRWPAIAAQMSSHYERVVARGESCAI